jgi:hypothetical protein
VGKASPTEGTLPGAVYFIAKYKDFKAAAQANAMVRARRAAGACAEPRAWARRGAERRYE